METKQPEKQMKPRNTPNTRKQNGLEPAEQACLELRIGRPGEPNRWLLIGLVLIWIAQRCFAFDFEPAVVSKWPGYIRGGPSAVAVQGDYAYVGIAAGGLAIVDIRDPAHPERVGGMDFGGWVEDVAVSGNYAYVVGLGGLQVLDITNPAQPLRIGGAGFADARRVALSGHYAYLAASRQGLQVVDVADPANLRLVGHLDGTAFVVAAAGNMVYVHELDVGVKVVDVSDPANPKQIGTLPIGIYAVPDVTVSGQYAYVATGVGLEVFDISKPEAPQKIGVVDAGVYVDAVAVFGNYAYVGEEERGHLQVVDVSDPRNPQRVSAIAGGIRVAISGQNAYVTAPSGLQLVDISNLASPQNLGVFNMGGSTYGVALSGNYAYLADGDAGLTVLDLTYPERPRKIGGIASTYIGYFAKAVIASGNRAYLADDPGLLEVIDITTPAHPERVGGLNLGGHAYGLAISGNLAFMAAGWNGLHIIDVSNPAHLQRLSTIRSVATDGYGTVAVAISGGYAYVADGNAGFQVIDVSNAANPRRVGGLSTNGRVYGVALSGSFAYLAGDSRVVNIADPTNPRPAADLGWSSWLGGGVAVSGNYAWLASFDLGFEVIDISDPAHPQARWNVSRNGQWYASVGIAVAGPYACFPDGDAGLQVVYAKPSNPQRLGTLATGSYAGSVAVSGSYAYVAGDGAGLQVVDVSHPANPQRVGNLDTPGDSAGVVVSGNYAYVADGGAGLQVIDVTSPANPQWVGGYETSGWANSVATLGNYVCVAENTVVVRGRPRGSSGLEVIDVTNPSSPQQVGNVATADAWSVAVSGSYAYVAAGCLAVIDLSNPMRPVLERGCKEGDGFLDQGAFGVTVSGRYVYLVTSEPWSLAPAGSLIIYDITDPANPQWLSSVEVSVGASGVAVAGRYAYIANETAGLEVVDVGDPVNPRRVGGNTLCSPVGIVTHNNLVFAAAGDQGLVVLQAYQPLRFESVPSANRDGFRFLLNGLAGQPVHVQRTRDFSTWEDWRLLTLDGKPVELIDPDILSKPQSFYRAIGP